eukprot:s5020_g19.t1
MNDLWACLAQTYQYEICDVGLNKNCSLMQGCVEVPWKQNPIIYVVLERENLLIYDKEGRLQALDNTEIRDDNKEPTKLDFNRFNAIMMKFTTIAARSSCKIRSVSELKLVECKKVKWTRQSFNLITAAYLTNIVDNPKSLAVDTSNLHELANIVAAADCLPLVRRARLLKITEQIVGLVAATSLEQSVISAERFLPESEPYYVARNTLLFGKQQSTIRKQGRTA